VKFYFTITSQFLIIFLLLYILHYFKGYTMTKFSKLALAALFAFAVVGTTASADVAKGQKLYSKKLKDACGFSGAKFAASHTQDEWEEIKGAGKFADEVKKVCPKLEKGYDSKWDQDLYDFSYEFASDSGNVPSC